VTRFQRYILWCLRASHRWERLASLVIGRARYQTLKDWGWQFYLRESLRRVARVRE
jgi:hypothetical protein